jgi:hypothetical protein
VAYPIIFMKKNTTLISACGSLLFFFLVFSEYDDFARLFQIFPIILLVSLAFFRLRDSMFKIWSGVVWIYVPFSIILIALMQEYGSPFLRVEKDTVGLGLDVLLVIFSLCLAGWTYIFRGERKGE